MERNFELKCEFTRLDGTVNRAFEVPEPLHIVINGEARVIVIESNQVSR
jgi:hypothetical protein